MITGSNEIQPAQPLVQIITPIPRPTSTPTKAPLPTDTPVPPTSTPQPTFTPKPTYPPATRHVYQPSPTPPDPTAEIIAAFASCGGQYQGQAAAEREKAARSTLELGYHTPQELAGIIVQNCLAIAQVAPEPTATPQPTPTRQPTRTLIAPTPQPTQAHASLSATLATPFPTRSHISDLIAPSRKHKTDFHQFQNARWLNHNNPALANEIKIVSWIQDGLDSTEAEILEYLLYMVTSEKHHHQISSIVQMPFLKTPEPADISALNSLNRIVHDDPQHLDAILTHPTVANGITDAWTPIIATLQSAARAQPHLIAQLLDPNQVTIESRHIELPLAGEVQIDIIRTRNTASNALDLADHAIKASEAFMITPFPNNHVAILFAETMPHGNAGTNFNSHIAIGSEYDVDDGSHEARYLPHIIAHEIAHHYWADNADWIDEGISDFITSISEYTRIGTPIEATNEPCPLYDTIKDLERSRQQRGTAAFHCNYALGERLFVELHAAFGDVPFRQHLKTLYLRSEDNDFRNLLGIATTSKDVAEIFGDTDAGTTVLNRWINGTEPYDASRIDTTPPTNTIPSINGRIQSASLVLNKTDSPINSFSAQNPVQPQIRFKYTHNVAGGPHLRPIRIIEFYEDGHQTSNRTIQVEADQRSNGNTWTWHIPVGPHNQPWKPGQYWAMFYDGDLKIAEVQWLVTP